MRDYYDVLDIPVTATREQIKAQYKQLVRIYHPDRFTNAMDKAFAEEKLKEINIAFQVLCGTPMQMDFEATAEPKPQPVVDPPRMELGPLAVATTTVQRFQVGNMGSEAKSVNFIYSAENSWFQVSKGRRIYADRAFPLEFELNINTRGLTPGQHYQGWFDVELDGVAARVPLVLQVKPAMRLWQLRGWLAALGLICLLVAAITLTLPFISQIMAARAQMRNQPPTALQDALPANELLVTVKENGHPTLYISQIKRASPQWLGITGWSAATAVGGKQVAYLSDQNGVTEVYLLSVDAGISQQLTTNRTHKSDLSWSPDDKYLAYLSGEADKAVIAVIEVSTGHESHLPGEVVEGVTHYAWSPDGQTLLFDLQTESEQRVYRVGVRGDGLQQLTHFNSWDGVWSPDGATILVAAEDGVHQLSSQGQNLQQLTQGFVSKPGWSADGQYISFLKPDATGKNQELWVMHADGTKLRQPIPDFVIDYQWAPEGNQLAYLTGKESGDQPLLYVWAMQLDKEPQMLAEVNYPQFVWTR